MIFFAKKYCEDCCCIRSLFSRFFAFDNELCDQCMVILMRPKVERIPEHESEPSR